MMMGYGFGMGWIGMLIPFIIIVGIVYLIVYLLKRDDITGRKSSGNGANAILAERFARGEITQEQFEQMKVVLSK